MRTNNKVALVTGAASGIGAATAALLAKEGAIVWSADLIEPSTPNARALQLDVAREEDWVKAMDRIVADSGRLEIVVNCAGIASAEPIVDLTLEQWRRVMSINLDGVFLGTKYALRTMRATKSQGSIVNVASVSGLKAYPSASAYGASKAAIIHFSRIAAMECIANNDPIRVNSISPSGVKTPMWRTMPFFQEIIQKEGGEEQAFVAMLAPNSRWARADEVASAIVYLASDEAAFVNGTNLVFDNGTA
jgi:NAD(P)-dependent dehydrogenase (short-subunit alcohol dehydrogenase family)